MDNKIKYNVGKIVTTNDGMLKKRYIIKEGESFYYSANKEHYLINLSNKKAKILWVSTPPMF